MASVKWQDFIDGLKDGAGSLAKDELKGLVADAKADKDAFIQKQGRKLERYLTQLANGELTREEFESCMKDLVVLTAAQAAEMAQAAQTRAHRLASGIATLAIKGLITLL